MLAGLERLPGKLIMGRNRSRQYDGLNAGMTQNGLIIARRFYRRIASQRTSKKSCVKIANHLHPGVFKFPEVAHQVLPPIAASDYGDADFIHAHHSIFSGALLKPLKKPRRAPSAPTVSLAIRI